MLSRAVPILETARLRLRGFRPEDLDAHAQIMGDAAVYRHLGGKPMSREDTWRRQLCAHALWSQIGYGYWAIEPRAGGAWLGMVGFADFKRVMSPSIEGIPEMGWILAPEAQGQGIAGEAVAAATQWGDRMLGAPEYAAIIDAGNAPSIRVAERAGFTVREDAIYRDAPILLFRRPRPQG